MKFDLSKFSEQSMVRMMGGSLIDYSDFVAEIRRRIANGESVHPYHAKCAEVA
jgi:hypothetical protein